ncbi:MAG: hypothetical protein V2I43_15880, partial [Parvularcula sp.]|nr:hypothetical protein [Parvularcula sp.]
GVARQLLPTGCRVIFATGYSFDPDLFDGIECSVLRKPYEEHELQRQVMAAHRDRHELAEA